MSCPDDFSLEYSWQSGSVPPPYYYEYTVTLAADGRGSVILLPDYPQNQPQPRRAEFFVPASEIDRLCDILRAAGLFDRTWKIGKGESVGSESACMTVRLEARVIHVPYRLAMVDGLRIAPVYEAIRAIASDALNRLHSSGEAGMVE